MFPITLIYGYDFLHGETIADLQAVGLIRAEEVAVA